MATEKKLVKKTLIIHPIMDSYVRKTWAILIENGYDATYSTALNFMLLTAIMEAAKESGLDEKTTETIWGFLNDEATISDLNWHDLLLRLGDIYRGRESH